MTGGENKKKRTAETRRTRRKILFCWDRGRAPPRWWPAHQPKKTPRPPRLRGALLLLLLLLSPAATAAGMGIPDLGAGPLGQAGATVARPADLTALYYNPAALAWLEGVQLYADVRAIDHRITFQRLDAQGRNPLGWQPVQNSGGLAFAPVVGVSWHHSPFTLAAGGHPATGATGYEYPDPATVVG